MGRGLAAGAGPRLVRPGEPPVRGAPASGPAVGSAPGAPSAPGRAAPQPPTYNGAPEQPYGYEQGGYHSRYDEPSHQGPHAGGYDEATSRYDYDAGPRGGGDYGRAMHDSGYGPDPYAQPSAGYRDYGTDSYSQGDYGAEQQYQGYEAGGYDSGSAAVTAATAARVATGYQDADYSGGYGGSRGYEQASDYGQPGGGHYGRRHRRRLRPVERWLRWRGAQRGRRLPGVAHPWLRAGLLRRDGSATAAPFRPGSRVVRTLT